MKLKARASFVRCFLELAANPKYLNSNFLNSIYRKEILGEDLITHVVTPSYIDRDTLEDIIDAKEKGNDIINMSIKQWYQFFLQKYIFMDHNAEENRTKCKAEQRNPNLPWDEIW